ncbi:MAG: PEP-CTERM sorting domain-containing protein [Pirellula sp.]
MNVFWAGLLSVVLFVLGTTSRCEAAVVLFSSDPFAGSTADPNDGVRTIFAGGQRSLATFDVEQDIFVFNEKFFDLPPNFSFENGLASALSGANIIVLQDAPTPHNAGLAANAIANAIDIDGAGLFIYWNSGLQVNRLVYSTNLNSATADLAILARINSPTGSDAINALQTFGDENFTVVPEPASMAIFGALGGMLGWTRLRRRNRV